MPTARTVSRSIAPLTFCVGAVVLAVLAAETTQDHSRQRESACNGLLPMPASAFAVAWVALGLAVVAVLAALYLRTRGDRFALTMIIVGSAVLCFAAFVLYVAIAEARPMPWLCSGSPV